MRRAFIFPLFALLVTVMSGPVGASAVAEEGRGSPIHLTIGTLGQAAGLDQFPLPSTTFRLNDRLYFFTQVTWDPGRGAPGVHHLLYKWFTPGAPLFSFGGDKEFKSAPMSWSAYMVGTHVGLGHHRAEVWIDDQLLDSHEFDIVPDTTAVTTNGEVAHKVFESVHQEVPLRDAIKGYARALLLNGDTNTFERETALLRSSGERTAAGAWKIYYFYHSLDDFGRADPTNPQWATLESTTARWLAATPDSPAAAIMAANVLLEHGWAYRGDGFADSVPVGSGTSYRALLERAARVLDEHRVAAAADPEWYALRIDVAKQQGASAARILDLAEQGLQKNPYYYPIHYKAIEALEPKWGGSEERIRSYVRMAVERSRSGEGMQAYGRIYVYIARNAQSPLVDLNLLGAKREPLEQSLREIDTAYPDEFNRDNARGIYCFAGFKEDFLALGRRPNPDYYPVAWWDTPEWRQQCDDWIFLGKEPESAPLSYRISAWTSFLAGFGAGTWRAVSLVALAAILVLEWLQRQLIPSSPSAVTPATGLEPQSFDASRYPRTYLLVTAPWAPPLRITVRILVVSIAVAWMLGTILRVNGTQVLVGFIVCVGLAVGSAWIVCARLMSRLVLRSDSLELVGPGGRRHLGRGEISTWGYRSSSASPGAGFRITSQTGKVLEIPPLLGADESLVQWFERLPSGRAPA